MQVALCGRNVEMPQYIFDITNVNTLFKQMRGKAVAQAMKTYRFGNTRFLFSSLKHLLRTSGTIGRTRCSTFKQVSGWSRLTQLIIPAQHIQ